MRRLIAVCVVLGAVGCSAEYEGVDGGPIKTVVVAPTEKLDGGHVVIQAADTADENGDHAAATTEER